MCGIFGVVGSNAECNSAKIFRSLFLLSESRGKEASGFAVIKEGGISIYKAPFQASEMVKTKVFSHEILKLKNNAHEAFTSIGHSRLVTNGYEQDENNNQPVLRNGFVVVHNGIIVNQNSLWGTYQNEMRLTDLDSELIPVIISNKINNGLDLGEAVESLYSEIYGMTNIGLLSSLHNNMIVATNNGSVYYIDDSKNRFFVFASERYILEKLIKRHKLVYSSESVKQLSPGSLISVELSSVSAKMYEFGQKLSNLSLRDNPLKINRIIKEDNSVNKYINTSLEHIEFQADKRFINFYEAQRDKISNLKRCTKCILPETFPYIVFDNNGVCNYCNNYKKHKLKGTLELREISEKHKQTNGKAECLMPFSGGRDSSYALHYVVRELGLKPIAFSYDWGMLTDLARRNQSRMCGKLGVEHILVSADIRKKRSNIRKNVLAWLKSPSLGTVPLFMAGDKQYFYYANLLMRQNDLSLSILGENLLETTNFKSGFCGIKPSSLEKHTYSLKLTDKIKMAAYYGIQFISNPSYLNSSLLDTLEAFRSYYFIKHNNLNIYDYIKWDEKTIENTLIDLYDWETDPGTRTTWRIGDGTAAFYNYIYYILAGFTENDTFRSNQIREGVTSFDDALGIANLENKPRWESILWYCKTIGIDFDTTIETINRCPKVYEK